MKLNWNPDHVTPPGIVQFGEKGVAIVRGVYEVDHAAVEALLQDIDAATPEEFVAAAVATGQFAASEWGVFKAVEYIPTDAEPVKPKRAKKEKVNGAE